MDAEAVLIPGGGLMPDGQVVPWVAARLDAAIAQAGPTTCFIPLSAGTTHKPPPLDAAGFPILESMAAAEYLMANGIAAARIFPETISLDTIGNAYFARIQQVDPLALRRLAVVTSAFHLPRTQAIFTWIFQLAPSQAYQLSFVAVPDIGFKPAALQARRDRERTSLANVQKLRSQLTSMAAVHRWLYREHAAYTAGSMPQRVQNSARDTY